MSMRKCMSEGEPQVMYSIRDGALLPTIIGAEICKTCYLPRQDAPAMQAKLIWSQRLIKCGRLTKRLCRHVRM